jgi:hypothetical protein
MNRNAAILGLASSAVLAVALWLAWSLRGTGTDAGASVAAAVEDEEPAAGERPLLLDRNAPGAVSERRASQEAMQTVVPQAVPPPSFAHSDSQESASDQDPLLVAGRVLDQDRSPVPFAHVIVIEPTYRNLPGPVVFETTTNRQGRFEIHGIAREFQPILQAEKYGYFTAPPQSFAWGDDHIELRLREGGVVAGSVRLDPWVPPTRIRVTIQPVNESGQLPPVNGVFGSPPLHLDPEGRFRFGGITSSTAVVSVRVESDPWEAARIENVPVREGNEPQDSRLEPIDLRGKLEVLAVSVLDDAGAKLDGARVVLSSSEDTDIGCSRVTSGGRAEFLTKTGPHDLEVERDGFRKARLAGVFGDQVVRLRKGIPVRVVLQGKSPDVKPQERIVIALLKGTRDRSTLGGMGTFDDPRQATFLVSSPGSYEIAWYLESGRDRKYITSSAGRTVQVGDLDGVQDLVVEFPSEALAALR